MGIVEVGRNLWAYIVYKAQFSNNPSSVIAVQAFLLNKILKAVCWGEWRLRIEIQAQIVSCNLHTNLNNAHRTTTINAGRHFAANDYDMLSSQTPVFND